MTHRTENICTDGAKQQPPTLKRDWVFRYVYGADNERSKKALIAVLNLILDRKENPVVDVTILNPISLKTREDEKETSMDIRARLDTGELIDVEMQRSHFGSYGKRAVYNLNKLVNFSLDKGEDYDKIRESIVISFVDGAIFTESRKKHIVMLPREIDEDFTFGDYMVVWHFIELGKLGNIEDTDELTGELERFMAYLKYAGDRSKEPLIRELVRKGDEAIVMSDRVFRELAKDDPEFQWQWSRDTYEHDMATLRKQAEAGDEDALLEVYKSEIREELRENRIRSRNEGLAEGREEGLAEGREEGRTEEKAAMARAMREKGIDTAVIAEISGLTEEQIQNL